MNKPKTNTTRRFRLIEEYEAAEKAKSSEQISFGLEDPEDKSLTYWNAMIIGPSGTPYANGLYTVKITAGPDYPIQPPVVKFETKINLPSVNQKSGEVEGKNFPVIGKWVSTTRIIDILTALFNEMKVNKNLPQPKEGEKF